MDSDKIRLTGLWRETSKAGTSYLSGRISASSKLLVLPNTHKKSDKDPDFLAFIAPVDDGSRQQSREVAGRRGQPTPASFLDLADETEDRST